MEATLPDGHVWSRVADPTWADPLDPSHSARVGGRFTAVGGPPTLYLNETVEVARANAARFMSRWPYSAADLRDDHAPMLVEATLPRRQRVADVRTPAGAAAVGLPRTYPVDSRGRVLPHERCQPVGTVIAEAGLRGVWYPSAARPGAGHELAWFPATPRSRAQRVRTLPFSAWYFGDGTTAG